MDVVQNKKDENNTYSCRIYFFKQMFSCTSVIVNFFMVGIYLGAPTVIIPQMRREANSTDFISPEMASWISITRNTVAMSNDEGEKNKSMYWFYLLRQLFSCSAVVLNFLMFGMYVGAPTVIIPQIRKEANSTDVITPEVASWISSIVSYSGAPWVIILPVLCYRYGRKVCVVLIALSVLIGNILFYYSKSVTELIISLAMQGMLSSSVMTITVMVVSEYTSPKYRGIFLTLKTATFFWGVWISNAIGTFYHWKNIGIAVFICGVCNLSSIFYKESPYWLATKGRFDECAKVHRWLKGTDEDSEAELRKLILTQQELLNNRKETDLNGSKAAKLNMQLLRIIRSKVFYKPFLSSALLIFLYSASGKMACTVYAIDIIKKITSSEQMAYKGMLILDGVTVAGMYLGSALSKVVTRRKQIICFSSTGVVFLGILSIYLYVIKSEPTLENHYVSIFLLMGYSLSIGSGPMILAPTCTAELAPLTHRSLYLCAIAFLNLVCFATILKIAPLIFIQCGTPGAFLFFSLASSFFIFLLYKYLPETKDKTIQEIEENMIKINSSDISAVVTEAVPLKETEI